MMRVREGKTFPENETDLYENSELSSKTISEKFHLHQQKGQICLVVLLFNLLLTFGHFPYYLYLQLKEHNELCFAALLLEGLAIGCGWWIYINQENINTLIKRWHLITKSGLIVILTMSFSLRMLGSIWSGDIEAVDLLQLVLVPITAASVFRISNIYTLCSHYFIAACTFCFLAILTPSSSSISIFIVYVIVGAILVGDLSVHSWIMFKSYHDLEQILVQKEINAVQMKAMEMREMIRSVAHDLKTPLTSFMTAMEVIKTDLETIFEQSVKSSDNVYEIQNSILSNINYIQDVHLFMVMIINRSIDYTKSSNGIELIPKNDVIELSKVIQLPIHSVTNIQNKITISCQSFPKELNQKFIKTDKQWLIENLLCLLSNAVKFSTEGKVYLNVSIINSSELQCSSSKSEIFQAPLQNEKDCVVSFKSCRSEDTFQHFTGISVHKAVTPNDSIKLRSPPKRGSFFSLLNYNQKEKVDTECQNQQVNEIFEDLEKNVSKDSTDVECSDKVSPLRMKYFPSSKRNKYSPEKDLNLQTNGSQSSKLLLFEVQDNGIELTQDELDSFFNPFKQKRLAGGTGLGVYSLAKRIDCLGGKFGVRRRVDGVKGTIVWFAIPYEPVEVPDSCSTPTAKSGSGIISEQVTDSKPFYKLSLRQGGKPSPEPVELQQRPAFLRRTSSNRSDHTSPYHSQTNLLKYVPDKSNLRLQGPLSDDEERNLSGNSSPSEPLSPLPSQQITDVSTPTGKFCLEKKPCILIVEDSAAISKMTSMMLKKKGFDTEIVDNGQIAVDKVIESYERNHYEKLDYSLILMDFQMPIMGGIEATSCIRQYEKKLFQEKGLENRSLILGISAMSDDELISEAKRNGIDGFIAKPFTIENILKFL